MTVATIRPSTSVEVARGDVLSLHPDRTWEQFNALQKGFEAGKGVKLFYYDGTVGILVPGRAHELFTSIIGFLIETFLFHHDIDFEPTGAMTQENDKASVQADRSYQIQGQKLSVEVNFTSGDLTKLKRYQALEVDEVWIWDDGILEVFHLTESGYESVNRSLIPALSSLDFKIVSECILMGETSVLNAAKKLLSSHS